MDGNTATLVAEHYRDTFEITYRMWQQRNRLFLVLLGVMVAGALVSATTGGTRTVLGDFLVSLLNIGEGRRAEEFRTSFPFGLVHLAVNAGVFYLMFNLSHRTAYVRRLYAYLEDLEKEIQRELGLGEDAVAFTREGRFYWHGRGGRTTVGERSARFAYVGVLGVLVGMFVAGQVVSAEGIPLVVATVVINAMTLVYYADYALSAIRHSTAPARPSSS